MHHLNRQERPNSASLTVDPEPSDRPAAWPRHMSLLFGGLEIGLAFFQFRTRLPE